MRRYLIALLAVLAVVLTGCGSAGSTSTTKTVPSSSAKVDAASGSTVTGSAYTFKAPAGWKAPLSTPAGYTIDSSAVDSHKTGSFTNNINVIKDTGSPASATLAQYETGGVQSLKSAGATRIKVDARTTIGGEDAVHITSMLASKSINYWVESFAVKKDGTWWAITVSFADTVSTATRNAISNSILATWAWTN